MIIGVAGKLGMDASRYHSVREIEYVTLLAALNRSLIASRANVINVDDHALCFSKPQPCVDFRFSEKLGLAYRSNYVCNEQRPPATTEYVVLYQNVTLNNIAAGRRKFAFAKVIAGCSRIKVMIGH